MSDEIPALEFANPLCPVCLEETDRDADAYSCGDCGIRWSAGGTEPARTGGAGRCRSILTRERGRYGHRRTDAFRCQRSAGHAASWHANADLLTSWRDGDAGVSEAVVIR